MKDEFIGLKPYYPCEIPLTEVERATKSGGVTIWQQMFMMNVAALFPILPNSLHLVVDEAAKLADIAIKKMEEGG